MSVRNYKNEKEKLEIANDNRLLTIQSRHYGN